MAEINENNRVIQWGDQGKVLVFLHYFGGSARSWQWVAEKLSGDYRCIAINFPGFGGAPALETPSIQGFAKYVQQELDRLGVKTYTLIGHSMGGKIALQVAANAAAGAVQQLILVAPSPPTTEPMPTKEKERMLHHPNRQEAEITVENAVKHTLTEDQHTLAVETQLIADPKTWRWWLLEGMEHSIADNIKLLHVPITVLASEDDPVITPDVIKERVMSVLDQAKLVNTRHVGHLSPLEVPDWIAAQIRKVVEAE